MINRKMMRQMGGGGIDEERVKNQKKAVKQLKEMGDVEVGRLQNL